MNKKMQFLLGLGTAWPLVYLFIFILFVFINLIFEPGRSSPFGFRSFLALMGVHLFTIVLSLMLLIFYFLDLLKNKTVNKDDKNIWMIALIFAGLVAMPVYWYRYIWKRELPVQK